MSRKTLEEIMTEPTEDYEVYDLMEWVEGSSVAMLKQWPNFHTEWWRTDSPDSPHDHHTLAEHGFVPFSVRTERFGFLGWKTRTVWSFRKTVTIRCQGTRGGPSISKRLTESISTRDEEY